MSNPSVCLFLVCFSLSSLLGSVAFAFMMVLFVFIFHNQGGISSRFGEGMDVHKLQKDGLKKKKSVWRWVGKIRISAQL